MLGRGSVRSCTNVLFETEFGDISCALKYIYVLIAVANGHHLHSSSLLVVSSAAAIAGACLSSLPLFLHLSSIYYNDAVADIIASSSPLHIPTPPLPPEKTIGSVGGNGNKEEHTSTAFKGSLGLPSPVVAVLRVGSGKLRMQEFCLVPLSGSSVLQHVNMIRTIYLEMGKIISSKSGVRRQEFQLDGNLASFKKREASL